MNNRVLLVDDDPNILEGYKRSLRKKFDVTTALEGHAALEVISRKDTFATIVSDMAMPSMNGIQFLSRVKEISPDSVRIMLTGNADLNIAINAVNDGNIFRFLTKPCPDDLFTKTLEAGIEQYRLITAERELLEKTLNGSIKVLTETLSLHHPEIFGNAMKLKELIRDLAKFLKISRSWEMEVAAMLAPIGYVGIPPALMLKIQKEEGLSLGEEEMLSLTPEIGAHLLGNIPRLESVAKIILYQNKRYDGTGLPKDSVSGHKILFGARLLKILLDLIQIESDGIPRSQAVQQLKSKNGWYDPQILEKVSTYLLKEEKIKASDSANIISASVDELRAGQILRSDIETVEGDLLLLAGRRLSWVQINLIRNHAKLTDLKVPLKVETTISGEDQHPVPHFLR
ncbi:response regulator [bacterium]|jgi:response regulator RpfG family c-di-GMP phosphodiesterase|nr:response regulator [bacterium]